MAILSTLWQDARYGARLLGRTPMLTLIAVLTLGLGIGANTAIFSVIDAVAFRSLPVEHAEQLVLPRWDREQTAIAYPRHEQLWGH
jgi:putative ABC transport system permease protein